MNAPLKSSPFKSKQYERTWKTCIFKKKEPFQLNFFVKYVESSTSIWTITLNFFFQLVYALLVSLWTSFRQAGAIEECNFFPICFVFAKSESMEQEREKVIKEHSVLEQI